MTTLWIVMIIATSLVSLGCGTLLAISETTTNAEEPGALVVNRRAAYSVTFDIEEPLAHVVAAKPGTSSIRGVDHERLLALDVRRMPFASGKLAVELTSSQLLKKVQLTSETGANRAADAAKAGIDARTEIEKLKEEAREAARKEEGE